MVHKIRDRDYMVHVCDNILNHDNDHDDDHDHDHDDDRDEDHENGHDNDHDDDHDNDRCVYNNVYLYNIFYYRTYVLLKEDE